ncbi:hypothetical protein [Corynebacterium argentoratense]|nr:hypothetical protein [Corynebacterium argentoratense]
MHTHMALATSIGDQDPHAAAAHARQLLHEVREALGLTAIPPTHTG